MTGTERSQTGVEPQDPELDEVLGEMRAEASAAGPAGLDALFARLEGQVEAAERRPTGWLRARSTTARTILPIGTFAVMAVLAGLLWLRPDLEHYPMGRMVLEMGAMAVLLVASVKVALRPVYRPPLPEWLRLGLVPLVLIATFVIAALPPAHLAPPFAEPPAGATLVQHATPCLIVGLLMGLPVFVLARLVDRGSLLGPVLAASAAGLAGDFVMRLHCPVTSTDHMIAGHFSTVLVYIVGIAAIDALVRRFSRG